MIRDFIALLYPEVCAACGNSLYKHETCICNKCYISLPKSNFHKDPSNQLVKSLEGRFPFTTASCYYLFNKKSKVQKLLHALKYKNNPEVGFVTGSWFGSELKEAELFNKADYIIPVPLHPNRQMQRGYNQSERIAAGMATQLNIPVDHKTLIRASATNTQTKKGRSDRWTNVENIFALTDIEKLKGKTVILVDDVITTGSTIEAAATTLLKTEGIKLCIASLAYANN